MVKSKRKTWLLFVISIPAGIAMWGGWVTLGQMSGFGVITPLPGLFDQFTLNTAITLPLGIEAYGIYAFHVALSGGTPRLRWYSWISCGIAVVLALTGQITFHVLQANHVVLAPVPIIVGVSCVPVVTFALATGMHVLLGAEPQKKARQINARGLSLVGWIGRTLGTVEPVSEPLKASTAKTDTPAPRKRASTKAGTSTKPSTKKASTNVVSGTAVLKASTKLSTKATAVPVPKRPAESTDPLLLDAENLKLTKGRIPTQRELEQALKIGRARSRKLLEAIKN